MGSHLIPQSVIDINAHEFISAVREVHSHGAVGARISGNVSRQASNKLVTDPLTPTLDRLSCNGAAYLDKANFDQRDWQAVFNGPNYDRLRRTKGQYGPADLLYVFLTTLGGEHRSQRADGCLCRA